MVSRREIESPTQKSLGMGRLVSRPALMIHTCISNVNALPFSIVSCLNVKALLGAFNQEKALIGAFSVIVRTDGSFAALVPSHESDWARKHFLKCVETGRWS